MLPETATFPALLARNTARSGASTAVVTADRSITHAALDHDSAGVAAGLVAAGVGKGARVGLLAPNGVEWTVTAAAAWRVGATLVPLSTLLRPPELAAQLRSAAVTHLVITPEFRGRDYHADLEAAAAGVHDVLASGGRVSALPSLRAVWSVTALPAAGVGGELVDAMGAAVRAADDFVVLHTSGSRGAPKGTVHTHGGALRAVASGLADRCVGPDDRIYLPMPFFWTGGLAGGLLSALVAGATLLTEAVPEPGATLALLARERATLFRGWPDQAARLAAHPGFADVDLSSLGGGSLPAVLPADRRPVPGTRANLFGMTETFGPYCGARADRDLPPAARGSCGRPFPGVEVRIVEPESGQDAAPAAVGEIHVRGPNVMRAIRGRTRDATFDAAGWYATGDLGARDADGYLWYHGRRDDMFKVKGATVYPNEVEAALRTVPGVRQVHVTNVVGPDGLEEVGALVVTSAPLAEIAAAARERVSAFKLPTRWLLAADGDAVPMTATAKVDQTALRARLTESGVRTPAGPAEAERKGAGG